MARCQFNRRKNDFPSVESLLGKDIYLETPDNSLVFWRVSAISGNSGEATVTLHYKGSAAFRRHMSLETLRFYLYQGEWMI